MPGREVRCRQAQLVDEVDADVADLAVVAARVHVESAVHGQQVRVRAAAVDRRVDAEARQDFERVGGRLRRAWDERGQLERGTAVEGHVFDLCPRYRPRDFGGDRSGRIRRLQDLGRGVLPPWDLDAHRAVAGRQIRDAGRRSCGKPRGRRRQTEADQGCAPASAHGVRSVRAGEGAVNATCTGTGPGSARFRAIALRRMRRSAV